MRCEIRVVVSSNAAHYSLSGVYAPFCQAILLGGDSMYGEVLLKLSRDHRDEQG